MSAREEKGKGNAGDFHRKEKRFAPCLLDGLFPSRALKNASVCVLHARAHREMCRRSPEVKKGEERGNERRERHAKDGRGCVGA